MHRITSKSDWAEIQPSQYNKAQAIAAATKGILTPGNIVTLVGFLLVIYGLFALMHQEFLLGVIALVVGRLFDILDGVVAEATKTKNTIGEIFDATVDKISTLLTIIVLFIIQITELWVLLLLALPHILISLIIMYKRSKARKVHPTRVGKISMALAWVAIIGLIIVPITATNWSNTFTSIVYTIVFVSSGLGFYAAWQYFQEKSK